MNDRKAEKVRVGRKEQLSRFPVCRFPCFVIAVEISNEIN